MHPETAPDATRHLAIMPSQEDFGTQRLDVNQCLELGKEASAEEAGGTQRLDLSTPGMPSASDQRPVPPAVIPAPTLRLEPTPPSSMGWKLPVAMALLAVAGLVGYRMFSARAVTPPALPPSETPAVEAIPPGAKAYFDQAKAGDANAMRMLGVMYYYGLNVPQDREKGLYWYRQAADKGSETARAELNKLEGKAP
jgi:hypothetical protein